MTIEKSNATYLQQQPTLEERVRIFSRYRRMRQQQACTLQCDRVSKVVGRTDELVMVCGWHLIFISYFQQQCNNICFLTYILTALTTCRNF